MRNGVESQRKALFFPPSLMLVTWGLSCSAVVVVVITSSIVGRVSIYGMATSQPVHTCSANVTAHLRSWCWPKSKTNASRHIKWIRGSPGTGCFPSKNMLELASSASIETSGNRHINAFADPEFSSKFVVVAPGITQVTPTPNISSSLCKASAKLPLRSNKRTIKESG